MRIDSMDLGKTNVGTMSADRIRPFISSGRGFGKNAAAKRALQVRIAGQWQDAYSALYAAWQNAFVRDVRAEVAAAIEVSPREDHSIPPVTAIHYACAKPTDPPPPAVGSNWWMEIQANEVLRGRRTFASVVAEMEAAR